MHEIRSLAAPGRLRIEELLLEGGGVTVRASARGRDAVRPVCGSRSRRVPGHYTRTLADLPWGGVPVRLRVRVRKFFCDEPSCERRIFAERLEKVARPFARGADRRREALEWIVFALGGEAGARLAHELGLLVSPDTLLNRIRGAFGGNAEDVRVVGVDDFGFRRGNAPGTILVDLERRRVVDLFEGHSAESIARWLERHPGVKVVARDRSRVCREGADIVAPKATQVADRWHLLHRLTQALEEFLLRKRRALRDGASGAEDAAAAEGDAVPDPTLPARPGSWLARARKRPQRSATSAWSSNGGTSAASTWPAPMFGSSQGSSGWEPVPSTATRTSRRHRRGRPTPPGRASSTRTCPTS